ncbi:MAG: mechanosensitive ion channel [Kiritimatiellae bacterium]|nr:mechanosensitive ion channel [Kiritimatiellia bacterium]
MVVVNSVISKWFANAGLAPFTTKVASASACVILLAIGCVVLGAIMAIAVRHFLLKRTDSVDYKGKLTVLIRVSRYFLFAWIFAANLPDALQAFPDLVGPISRVLDVVAIVLCAAMLSSSITCLSSAACAWSKGRILASKTLSQMLKILIWFTASIIMVSALMGKSPTFVLSGLGALTAVLMLIFRDSLLGLVAGIQISQNDMVRIGDWITMAKYNADGNVIDIALTTVKVRNFDNTVTMIPSSALISDAFINWRYMSTSKGRRIKRPVWISVTSIREFSEEDCARLVEQGLLEIGDQPVSNLAAFETWLGRMLSKDERISQELTCMVRQTEAGDTGIPVEVYAFTKTRDWLEYEKIQTDIFDKIFVAVPKFDLRIYQRTGDKFQ